MSTKVKPVHKDKNERIDEINKSREQGSRKARMLRRSKQKHGNH